MERGDTGLGRDAYGPPRRRRLGERRAHRGDGRAEGSGARGTNGVDGLGDDEDDQYYSELLRGPGDLPSYPRRPSPPRTRQPGGVPPPAGHYAPDGNPGGGYSPGGNPAGGYPRNENPAYRYPPDSHAAPGGPVSRPASRGPVSGGPVSGGQVGRGPVSGGPVSGGPVGRGPVSAGPVGRGPQPGREYRLPYGRQAPPATDQPYRPPAPGSAGATHERRGPGHDPPGGMWRRPSAAPGARPGPVGPQAHRRMPGSGPATPAGTPPESARPAGAAQPVASIAPDGLHSFARDLRALRAKAELDYPELAELSHYTMKTLASAAGGLRLPALPVAVAYVRACGGNVAEWEDRWQKLAAKISADGATEHRGEADEQQAPPEPADAPGHAEPLAPPAAHDPDPGPGAVYVITSAKPHQPSWPAG